MSTQTQISQTPIQDQFGHNYEALQARMKMVFSLVENKDHWKGPIDAVVLTDGPVSLEEIAEAVEFFTATKATFSQPFIYRDHRAVRIMAPGYWRGPAA